MNEGAPSAVFSAQEDLSCCGDRGGVGGGRCVLEAGAELRSPGRRCTPGKTDHISCAKCQQEPCWLNGPVAGLREYPGSCAPEGRGKQAGDVGVGLDTELGQGHGREEPVRPWSAIHWEFPGTPRPRAQRETA